MLELNLLASPSRHSVNQSIFDFEAVLLERVGRLFVFRYIKRSGSVVVLGMKLRQPLIEKQILEVIKAVPPTPTTPSGGSVRINNIRFWTYNQDAENLEFNHSWCEKIVIRELNAAVQKLLSVNTDNIFLPEDRIFEAVKNGLHSQRKSQNEPLRVGDMDFWILENQVSMRHVQGWSMEIPTLDKIINELLTMFEQQSFQLSVTNIIDTITNGISDGTYQAIPYSAGSWMVHVGAYGFIIDHHELHVKSYYYGDATIHIDFENIFCKNFLNRQMELLEVLTTLNSGIYFKDD